MRIRILAGAIGALLLIAAPGASSAQMIDGGLNTGLSRSYGLYGVYSPYGAPGYYGTSYGVPGFGYTRTYSAFSSPYGMGYGYGYAPYGYADSHYGVGLWRPGYAAPGYVYGASYYRTFPVPFRPLVGFGPPIGLYGPAYGAPSVPAW